MQTEFPQLYALFDLFRSSENKKVQLQIVVLKARVVGSTRSSWVTVWRREVFRRFRKILKNSIRLILENAIETE